VIPQLLWLLLQEPSNFWNSPVLLQLLATISAMWAAWLAYKSNRNAKAAAATAEKAAETQGEKLDKVHTLVNGDRLRMQQRLALLESEKACPDCMAARHPE
jgi:hypothetical protein